MIDIYKQYQTRSGHPVRLFTTARLDSEFPVVGEWQNQEGTWVIHSWDSTGRFIPNEDYVLDLVEVSDLEENSLINKHLEQGWEWYTSNSYLRLGLAVEYQHVLEPVKSSSDGHSDLHISDPFVKSLIVAAPDLYNALDDFLHGETWTTAQKIINARKALAKARGEK